jgi:transcription termination factor NusB
MDSHTRKEMQRSMDRITRANKAVLLAMGALFAASLNATKAMQDLYEVMKREDTMETPEENQEVDQALEQLVDNYKEGIN